MGAGLSLALVLAKTTLRSLSIWLSGVILENTNKISDTTTVVWLLQLLSTNDPILDISTCVYPGRYLGGIPQV
jgi:hypothetical protein